MRNYNIGLVVMKADAEVALLVLSVAILQPQDWIFALEPDVHAAVREMRARQCGHSSAASLCGPRGYSVRT